MAQRHADCFWVLVEWSSSRTWIPCWNSRPFQAIPFGTAVPARPGMRRLGRTATGQEDSEAADACYQAPFAAHALLADLRIVSFPDFDTPIAHRDLPTVTDECTTHYQTEETRR